MNRSRAVDFRIGHMLAVLALALTLALPAGCKKGVFVEGKVIDVDTGKPLAGASVQVSFIYQDANMNWLSGGNAQLVSGPDGTFSTSHPDMRARFTVLARLDGYYPNYDAPYWSALKRSMAAHTYNTTVRLFPVRSPQPLPGGTGEARWVRSGRRTGWSFAQGRMVDEAQADFICEPDEAGQDAAYLTARGQGGFVHADWLYGEYAMYNMPVAQEAGYTAKVDLRAVDRWHRRCYFVRTADGAHYAKIDVIGTTKSPSYVGVRFDWAFQPNGTRALEIPLVENSR